MGSMEDIAVRTVQRAVGSALPTECYFTTHFVAPNSISSSLSLLTTCPKTTFEYPFILPIQRVLQLSFGIGVRCSAWKRGSKLARCLADSN